MTAWVGVAALALVVAVVWVMMRGEEGQRLDELLAGSVQSFPDQGRSHEVIPDFAYNSDPPTSGPHGGDAPCQAYSDPVPDAAQVHALEKGAIVIQYDPVLAPEEVRVLEAFAEREDEVLVAPRPAAPATVLVTAWARLMALDGIDEARIEAFITRYRNAGPEPAAVC